MKLWQKLKNPDEVTTDIEFQCFTVHFSIQLLMNTNTCTFSHSTLY